MVAIAAQAIYGKSFTVINNKSTSIGDVINLSKEQESRFSFALYACDISPKAAELSGLRWVDKDVKKNEKYLYRIYSLVPEAELKINFGYAFIGVSEILKLSAPREPTVKFGNQVAMIEWDPNSLRDIYTAYFVERSEDGKTFSGISKLPITPIADNHGGLRITTKIDSLRANDVEYYYRLQGVTPFGDKGPYSKLVSGKGIPPLRERGFISDYVISKQGTVLVRWKFSNAYEKEIIGFNVERGIKVDGPFTTLNKNRINPNQRSFEDQAPSSTNYYRIATLGKGNQKVYSHPYLIQLEDSIPPLAPTGLKATVDTTGIVKIEWKANEENDLDGYHLYRSNFASSEFNRITKDPIQKNSYVDTINIKTLTSKIYYKVSAIDNRFNASSFSPMVKLVKPDVVPPVPPQIESVRSMTSGVKICWISSVSEDVAMHRLLRKELFAQNWKEIKVFYKEDSTCFVDRPPVTRNSYEYKMVAEDSAKHYASSPVFTAKVIAENVRPAVEKISTNVNRTEKKIVLSWEYREKNVVKYQIFRASDNEKLSLLKTISNSISYFEDIGLKENSTYQYIVKAFFSDGSESRFSAPVTVEY